MERDFMGLAVKQETVDEAIDAAPLRSSSPVQWSFSNKPPSVPHLSPFQSAREGKSKTGFDSLASSGLVTITTTTEALDSNHKSYSGFMQKDIVSENQGGVGYTLTTYPMHHRVTNQTILPHQPLSGVPTTNPVPTTPSRSPVVGRTDLRIASKISGAPAQLTMFYNGSVSVYENISPEKVEAIMLLAGNGPPMNSSPTISSPPIQASMPRSSILDGIVVSQPYSTTPFRSSPTPISSISGSRFSGWPSTIADMNASKQGSIHLSSYKVEPQKVVNAPGTVPQFRKKSLARFLEKRKERVIDASPYANSTSLSLHSSSSCQPID